MVGLNLSSVLLPLQFHALSLSVETEEFGRRSCCCRVRQIYPWGNKSIILSLKLTSMTHSCPRMSGHCNVITPLYINPFGTGGSRTERNGGSYLVHSLGPRGQSRSVNYRWQEPWLSRHKHWPGFVLFFVIVTVMLLTKYECPFLYISPQKFKEKRKR